MEVNGFFSKWPNDWNARRCDRRFYMRESEVSRLLMVKVCWRVEDHISASTCINRRQIVVTGESSSTVGRGSFVRRAKLEFVFFAFLDSSWRRNCSLWFKERKLTNTLVFASSDLGFGVDLTYNRKIMENGMGVRKSMWLCDKYKNECGIEWEKWIGIEGWKNGLWVKPRLNRVDEDGEGWNGSSRIIFKEIGGWRAKKEGISLENILAVVWNVLEYGNRL